MCAEVWIDCAVPRRRRSRAPRYRRLVRRWLRSSWPAIALVFGAILAVNGAVRSLGGDVSWLSLERFEERADALFRLSRHRLVAIWRADVEDDPHAVLRAAAQRHGLSPRLLLGVARAESDFVPTRISGTGAMGLMQLMPATADELGVEDPFDAADSADGGARYLKRLLSTYRGDVQRALAAYNAGPGRVAVSGRVTLPAETRSYVARITAGW